MIWTTTDAVFWITQAPEFIAQIQLGLACGLRISFNALIRVYA